MMKKSSYMILFIACFTVILFLNVFQLINPDFPIIVGVILVSLMESLIPYLIIILIVRIINRDSKST
jgi:hypothetical protein